VTDREQETIDAITEAFRVFDATANAGALGEAGYFMAGFTAAQEREHDRYAVLAGAVTQAIALLDALEDGMAVDLLREALNGAVT